VPLRANPTGAEDSGKQLHAEREHDERDGDGGCANDTHDRVDGPSPTGIVSRSADARQRLNVMARRSTTHTITTIISMTAS
jgi:hypothetical protein